MPKPKLSSHTIQILSDTWERICKHNPVQLPELVNINAEHIQQIMQHSMYSSIPEQIRREFETTSQHGVKIMHSLPNGNRNVAISILAPDKYNTDDWAEYVNRILIWLYFVDEIASPQCAQTLNIFLLLTDAKKELPANNGDNIDMIHANTAFTTSCSKENTIFLFRREEWFKVFIHETFHCFGLDFSASDNTGSNRRILSIFPVVSQTTDIRLYETYCEMWAEIFNMMFVCFYKPKCLPFLASPFIRILSQERIFSIRQSNKILRRAGYQYAHLFAPPSRGKHYTENTQAFSYYVVKSLILWNLDDFIKWCATYSDTIPPIQFPLNRVSEYCDLIEQFTNKDREYRQTAEQIIKTPMRKTARNYGNVYSEKTLRMTLNDINVGMPIKKWELPAK